MATIQDVLAGFDFSEEIKDDQLVTNAVVLVTTVDQEGDGMSFWMAANNNIDLVTKLGMVTAAAQVMRNCFTYVDDEEDGD